MTALFLPCLLENLCPRLRAPLRVSCDQCVFDVSLVRDDEEDHVLLPRCKAVSVWT